MQPFSCTNSEFLFSTNLFKYQRYQNIIDNNLEGIVSKPNTIQAHRDSGINSMKFWGKKSQKLSERFEILYSHLVLFLLRMA